MEKVYIYYHDTLRTQCIYLSEQNRNGLSLVATANVIILIKPTNFKNYVSKIQPNPKSKVWSI